MGRRLEFLGIGQSIEHLDVVDSADFFALSNWYFRLVHISRIARLLVLSGTLKLIPIDLVVFIWVLTDGPLVVFRLL